MALIFTAGDKVACTNCHELLYQVNEDVLEEKPRAKYFTSLRLGIPDPEDYRPLECPFCDEGFNSVPEFLKKAERA